MYESWGEVTISRCYLDEPCEHFPRHPDLQSYIDSARCDKKGGIDALHIIMDIRRREHLFYDPHHHIIVIRDIARDGLCGEILLGKAYPIVPTSLPGFFTRNAVFAAPGVAVISVGSLKKFYGDDWSTAFIIEAARQLGYLYGLPDSESPYYKQGSCLHEYCVMGKRYDRESFNKILVNNPNLYCKYDLKCLVRNLDLVHRGYYFY